jgi:hypothetical protein
VAAARKAKIFTDGFADDRAAGVEDAGRDGGVDLGDVAFEARGAVHHRHAGKADIVLERHELAVELARGGAGDLGLDVPRSVRIVLGRRAPARPARVGDRRQFIRRPVELVVGADARQQRLMMRRRLLVGETHAEFARDLAQLRQCRELDGSKRHVGSFLRNRHSLQSRHGESNA